MILECKLTVFNEKNNKVLVEEYLETQNTKIWPILEEGLEVMMRKVTNEEVDFSNCQVVISPRGEKLLEIPEDTNNEEDVTRPSHYQGNDCFDVMDLLRDKGVGGHALTALKYIWRCTEKHESPIGDLKKAIIYLEREVKYLESTASKKGKDD